MQALGPDNIDRSPSKPKLTNSMTRKGLYKTAAGLSARPVNTQMLAKMKDLGVDKEIPLKKLQVERLVSVLSTMSRWFSFNICVFASLSHAVGAFFAL